VETDKQQAIVDALRDLTQERLRGKVSEAEYERRVRALESAARAAGVNIGIGTGSFDMPAPHARPE
jgi:hypothetical protein